MPTPLNRRNVLTFGVATALATRILPLHAVAGRPHSVWVWSESWPDFGGFSGFELMPDRVTFFALSDRGYLVRGHLLRDAGGQIMGVETLEVTPLHGGDGGRLRPAASDSEGLALAPDGSFLVAFEGWRFGRVARFASPAGAARTLPRDAGWRTLPSNASLETLALDAGGTIYTIPETPGAKTPGDRGFAIYRFDGGNWAVIGHLPRRGAFVPVGADFGPDGNLYLLERKFRLAFFATRISRLRPGGWNQPETLVETGYGLLDNHEGISVTRDGDGRLWATTISDDNQNRFQRTEIAEFPLT